MRKQGKLNLEKNQRLAMPALHALYFPNTDFQGKLCWFDSEPMWVIDVAISLYTLPTLIIKKENLTKLLSTTSMDRVLLW